jgi:hypothetical protein
MVSIYVLELEDKKYYIGKTKDPDSRIDQHFNLSGSQWTKKYKPKNILEIIPNCDNFDEDKYTLKYMEKFGIDNVRGGTFCEVKLSEDNLETIKKMINGSTNKCYICGKNGHFAKNCEKNDDNILGEISDDEDESIEDEIEPDESESDEDELNEDESDEDESDEDELNEDELNEDESNEDESNEDESNEDESNEDESNEDESNEDESNEDESNEDESNG